MLSRSSLTLVLALGLFASLPAQVPQLLTYQGRVAVQGVNFHGSGQFRFALVDANGTTTFWSNDGTSTGGGAPVSAVALGVSNGLYSVLLGDPTLANMTAIPASVFDHPHVRLRVWFDDGANGIQQLAPDQRIAAVGYAIVAGNVPDGAITAAKLAPGAVTATSIANGAITATQLATGAAAANLATSGQSGVASGGLILGASANSAELLAAGYVYSGAVRVNDAWTPRSSVNAPSARYRASAVWTGAEMIVWGGIASGTTNTYLADGGRYSPATDAWTALPAAGAPAARALHTAVWTGTRMIVWGGLTAGDVPTATGARYDPATGAWGATLVVGAPSPRSSHTAVWTGSEMIVYGGTAAAGAVEDGARYAFATNSWTTLPAISPGNPMPRTKHSAIWTGAEMIVWGGSSSASQLNPLNSGARYHRANNAWSLTAPGPAGRASHACCWTGSEMIIWGGAVPGGSPGIVVTLNDGARYDPAGNAWTTMQGTPPLGRSEPATLWTGTLFVVWGNSPNEGGAYSPERNNWQPIALLNAPTPRLHGSFVWTGTQGIYFGGADLALGPISSNETWAYTPARFLHLYARP